MSGVLRILLAIYASDATSKEIKAATGLSQSWVAATLSALDDAGLATRDGRYPARWRLVMPAGEREIWRRLRS